MARNDVAPVACTSAMIGAISAGAIVGPLRHGRLTLPPQCCTKTEKHADAIRIRAETIHEMQIADWERRFPK